MATYAKILDRRVGKAKARQAKGKASKGQLRLLARIEVQERRKREDAERMAAFEYAVSK